MEHIRQRWSSSKTFRILLLIALMYAFLRFALHGVYVSGALVAEGQTEPVIPAEFATPADLDVYIAAARHLQNRENLYPDPTVPRIFFYQYSPTCAAVFAILFLWFSPKTIAFVHTLLHIIAYVFLYFYWQTIFQRLNLDRATGMLTWTLPLWIIFSAFWVDLSILNIRVFMALLLMLLVDAILHERLGFSLLWVSLILLAKPQWAVVVALPLLLGRRRFFLELIGLAIISYVVVAGITILVLGPAYGLQQYRDYYLFLLNARDYFPWSGPDSPFLGNNHSITQIVVYMLGVTPGAFRLATGAKLSLLMPLVWIGMRHLLRPEGHPGHEVAELGLNFAFALHLGAWIWLDVAWSDAFLLGIVIFPYLLVTSVPRQRIAQLWTWGVFLLCSLLDFFRIVGFAILGPEVFVPEPYLDLVRSDLASYIPLLMIAVLTCYVFVVRRLWMSTTSSPT